MSDSSSSDEEESRFKEVCDPMLWRTAGDGGVRGSHAPVQAATKQHSHNLSNDKQLLLLLEKVKTSLAATKTKTASPYVGYEGSCTHRSGSETVGASIENVAAPSTLSPYLAKQLAIRLDRSVGYYSSQEDLPSVPPSSEVCDSTNHQSFHLLKNLTLIHQETSETNGRKGRVKLPKRLTYYNSSDEDEVKSRCSSVAVSSEWILAGGESCPRPHPKNVRYLDEYKVKERRANGSIVAVPCSTLDSTLNTRCVRNGKRKKPQECVPENKKDSASCEQEKVNGFQNGVVKVKENTSSNVNTKRKQARKRGKKKKNEGNSEINASK